MLKKELSHGVIQYVFEPNPGQHFANRITALIDEDKVVLIDTGYEHQAVKVVEDLHASHLEIKKVIISHFHDDHMEGLKVLPDVTVYGSSYYQETLDMWIPKEDHKYFTPTVLVEESLKIQLGRHKIEMIPYPGHSICTILVKINDKYVHIADELMFSNKGEPLLPCIRKKDVRRQFTSVNGLRDYSHFTFIPAHGEIIKDQKRIEDEIENVSLYLKAILSNNDKITFEEATKRCSCTFLHKEWHENVYK